MISRPLPWVLLSLALATTLWADSADRSIFERCADLMREQGLSPTHAELKVSEAGSLRNRYDATKPAENDDEYLRGAQRIRKEGLRHFPGWTSTQTVLYPMIGIDAPMGFLLFPGATTVIGLDKVPFMLSEPSQDQAIQPRIEPLGTWMHWRDVSKGGALADRIIGALREKLPGFRLKAVRALYSGSSPITIMDLYDYSVSGPEKLSLLENGIPHWHGVIEFDTGDGTPLRRYVHINANPFQHDYSRTEGRVRPWWWQVLNETRLDALITKAAINFLLPHGRNLDQRFSFRDEIAHWISRARGFVVEDLDTLERQWEFTGAAADNTVTTHRELVIEDAPFGYGQKAHVVQMGELPQPESTSP